MNNRAAELIFTDLDGTLLDHDTYGYEGALPGLELLRSLRIPLVMVSSKTYPEMASLHAELSLHSPFIFENGGGIAWVEPESENGFSIELLGPPPETLALSIPALEGALGSVIVPITAMSAEEIASRTGLTPERARLAQDRRASLPFVPGNASGPADLDRVNAALAPGEIRVTRGGRFYHLIGAGADKGDAVKRVIAHYTRMWGWDSLESGGIGDGENDVPFLRAVSMPVLVRRHDGGYTDCDFPVEKTMEAGPAGFSEAVKLLCGAE